MTEVALFETALRAAVRAQPDPALRASLVPRLAQTARAATLEAETQATRRTGGVRAGRHGRLASVARVGIAVALIPLVLAGLAFAGVTVPGPARDAFKAVGVTLPNQPSDHGAASLAPASGTKGNDVSEAAHNPAHRGKGGNSAAAHRHALEQRHKARGLAKGHTQGKAIGLTGSTPPGRLAPVVPHHATGGSSTVSHGNSSHTNSTTSHGKGGQPHGGSK